MHPLSRRAFLGSSLAAPAVCTTLLRGADAPSERVTLGFIGVGTMGRGHLGSFLRIPGVEVLAVADVVAERRDGALQMVAEQAEKADRAGKSSCKGYNDFRELLARKDIDAVVIATPDHWHAIPCVLAAEAGKDIYCEKPLTNAVAHGRKVVEAVARHKRIFQTGSQQRTEFGGKFRQAVELVRNGRIGKVKTVRVGVGGPARPCDLPTQEAPAGTDWDFWLGPAPKRGYNEALCPKGVHRHFPAWRSYREYAGGGLADMGAHHFDIAQWALDMDATGPTRITPPEKGETGLTFTYASGVVMVHGGPSGCTFEGSEGTLYVDRGVIKSTPEGILKEPLGEKATRVRRADDHRRNWLEGIRTRKECVCPAEVGHRSSTVCQLGNIGYWLRRPLTWDPAREQFAGDAGANRLLDPELRGPWKLA